MQGICTSWIQEIEHEVSQLGDGIGTQESIQGNPEYTNEWINSYNTLEDSWYRNNSFNIIMF